MRAFCAASSLPRPCVSAMGSGTPRPFLSDSKHRALPCRFAALSPASRGWLCLGRISSGNDLDADEREMLDRLAVRAAAAYERVVTSLLLREVEQLKTQLALRNASDRGETNNS